MRIQSGESYHISCSHRFSRRCNSRDGTDELVMVEEQEARRRIELPSNRDNMMAPRLRPHTLSDSYRKRSSTSPVTHAEEAVDT